MSKQPDDNAPITAKEFMKQFSRYRRGSISRRHFLGVTGLGTAMAQSSKTEIAASVTKQYADQLKLTDEQIEAAKKVFAAHLEASRVNWQAADGDQEAFQSAQKATFKETDAKLKALLTDTQLEVYEAKKKDLKKKALDHYIASYLEN